MLSYSEFKEAISKNAKSKGASEVIYDGSDAIIVQATGVATIVNADRLYRVFSDLKVEFSKETDEEVLNLALKASDNWASKTGADEVFQTRQTRGAMGQTVLKQKCTAN